MSEEVDWMKMIEVLPREMVRKGREIANDLMERGTKFYKKYTGSERENRREGLCREKGCSIVEDIH